VPSGTVNQARPDTSLPPLLEAARSTPRSRRASARLPQSGGGEPSAFTITAEEERMFRKTGIFTIKQPD